MRTNSRLKRLGQALDLIAHYAPDKYRSLRRDIGSILVGWVPAAVGSYCHELRMVELSSDTVISPATTPETLATTLIHEAQHARLHRLGFDYEEPTRARIERICFMAEKNFAQKLPGCEALVAEAEAWLEEDLQPIFSTGGRYRAKVDELKELGCPNWIIKSVSWIHRLRAR